MKKMNTIVSLVSISLTVLFVGLQASADEGLANVANRVIRLQDIINSQSVEIDPRIDGAYPGVGHWNGSGEVDVSDYVGNLVCKKAGYAKAVSVTTAKVYFSKDTVKHDNGTFGSVRLADLHEDGSVSFNNEPIEWDCSMTGCGYYEQPYYLKSVRCEVPNSAQAPTNENDLRVDHSAKAKADHLASESGNQLGSSLQAGTSAQ